MITFTFNFPFILFSVVQIAPEDVRPWGPAGSPIQLLCYTTPLLFSQSAVGHNIIRPPEISNLAGKQRPLLRMGVGAYEMSKLDLTGFSFQYTKCKRSKRGKPKDYMFAHFRDK